METVKMRNAIKYISESNEYSQHNAGEQHYSIDSSIEGMNVVVKKSFYSFDFQQHVGVIAKFCKDNNVDLILVDLAGIADEYGMNLNLFIEDVSEIGLSVLFANKEPKSENQLHSS